MYILVYILLIYSLFLIFFLRRLCKITLFNPISLFLFSTVLITFFTSLQIVIYDYVFTTYSFILYFLALNLYILGSLLKLNFRIVGNFKLYELSNKSYLSLFMIPAIVYSILVIVETFSLNIANLDSLQSLRNAFLDEISEEKSLGILDILKGVTKSLSIPYLILLLVIRKSKFKLHNYIAIFAFLSIVIETAFQGGRTLIVYCIAMMIISYSHYSLKNRGINPIFSNKRRVIIFITAGLLSFILLFGVFPSIRNPALLESADVFIDYHHNQAEISPRIVKVVDAHPNTIGLFGIAFGSTYITAPLVKFTYYLEEHNVDAWYGWGAYNFPILEKMTTLSNKNYFYLRDKVKHVSITDKNESNPWSTGYRDFMIDFGLLGGLVFSFLSGFVLQAFYKSYAYVKNANLFRLSLCTLSSFSAMLIPFYSPYVVLGQSIILSLLTYFFTVIMVTILKPETLKP
jgi:hypothetical protein